MARLYGYLAVALALVAGLFTWGKTKERRGAKKAVDKMKEKDHEEAADIRTRVDEHLDDVVRKLDDAGFRDDE